MNHTDFHIGLVFMDCTGWWRCTDVGARTILAIRLDHDDPHWYEGPPYIVEEKVFDEDDIARCHLAVEESIRAAVHAAHTSAHPGFPHEVVTRMMEIRHAHPYPHGGVLRFDRKRPDGEVLHPFAGRKEADSWVVELYLPFEPPTRQWRSATSSRYRELRPMTSEPEQVVRSAYDARASARNASESKVAPRIKVM